MAVIGSVGEAIRRGEYLDRGTATFTGSVAITTNCNNISQVGITQQLGSSPGLGPQNFTYTVSGRTLTIFAWQPTSSANPTLIAATTSCTVTWEVTGKAVPPAVVP